MSETRVCTGCKIEKPLTEFYRRNDRRGRPKARIVERCKRCVCTKITEGHIAACSTPEGLARHAAKKRAERQRVKDAVFGAYGGYICKCCGETEKAFLVIDHIANDGYKARRKISGDNRSGGFKTYHWIVKQNFPEGLQVLCSNCNQGKRMNGGICPHQTRCNDYPLGGVGSSDPKRIASATEVALGEEIVSTAAKAVAAKN